MENEQGVPVEYTPVEPAPPAQRDFYKESQVEIAVQKERQKWIRRGLKVFNWLIGLGVAIVLSHYFPMYVHCLKETCTVPMTLLNFGIVVVDVATMTLLNFAMFVVTVVIWPVVILGMIIEKTVSLCS